MKNFIKLFLLNHENTSSTSVAADYENTLLGRLISSKIPSSNAITKNNEHESIINTL
jgi:hypothetical protein